VDGVKLTNLGGPVGPTRRRMPDKLRTAKRLSGTAKSARRIVKTFGSSLFGSAPRAGAAELGRGTNIARIARASGTRWC